MLASQIPNGFLSTLFPVFPFHSTPTLLIPSSSEEETDLVFLMDTICVGTEKPSIHMPYIT